MLGAAPAAATTFHNGSFEDPGFDGVFYFSANDLTLPGWTHLGLEGDESTQFGDFYTNGNGVGWSLPPAPGTGNYYVGFGSSGSTGGILEQTFDTVVGQDYVVNYLLSTTELVEAPFPVQVALVEIIDANGPGASVVNNLQAAPGWNPGLTLVFTAQSTSVTLRFTDLSSPGSIDLSLDNDTYLTNWALDEVTVATPEPGTFLFLGAGLALVGLIRKRR